MAELSPATPRKVSAIVTEPSTFADASVGIVIDLLWMLCFPRNPFRAACPGRVFRALDSGV